MTAKIKKILLYVGVSAAGIFSVFLLFSLITAQLKLVQVLSPPPSANPPGSSSRSSLDFSSPESIPTPGPGPVPDRPASPDISSSDRPWGARPGNFNRNPNLPPQLPADSGTDWPAGLGNSQDNFSGQIHNPSASGSPSGEKSADYTPPPPSWNKPFVPYKRYKEGEQPPWARPTKYVIETRKNDPNFNLLDSLDKRRKEIMEERERAEAEQNR